MPQPDDVRLELLLPFLHALRLVPVSQLGHRLVLVKLDRVPLFDIVDVLVMSIDIRATVHSPSA